MNRLRKLGDKYQVLITPEIKIAPDNPIMVGNWEDENLRNYYILEFDTLQAAQCEALKHPDIDWYRLVINHQHIFKRLEMLIGSILAENRINGELKSGLQDAETLKNTMFNRVMRGGNRFNLRYGMNDIITFTIINPWTNNLHHISKLLENHRAHLHRDDLRIRSKEIVDGRIICLYGVTEFGTIYEIRMVPTLLYQWAEWHKKSGFHNDDASNKLYKSLIEKQVIIDQGPVIR